MMKPRVVASLLSCTAVAWYSVLIMAAVVFPKPEPKHYFTPKDFAVPLPTLAVEVPPPRPVVLDIWAKMKDDLQAEEITYEYLDLEYVCDGYITAYCACSKCCWPSTGITASGTEVHYADDPYEPTTCAIDPKYFDFGDLFWIDGRLYVAEDTGSAVKGYHWDLYFPEHSTVASYGSHYEAVYRAEWKTVTFTPGLFDEYWTKQMEEDLGISCDTSVSDMAFTRHN